MFCNLFSLPKVYPLICILVSDTEFSFFVCESCYLAFLFGKYFCSLQTSCVGGFSFENLKVTGQLPLAFIKIQLSVGFVVPVVTPSAYFASDFFRVTLCIRWELDCHRIFSSAPVLLLPLDLPCVLPHENR